MVAAAAAFNSDAGPTYRATMRTFDKYIRSSELEGKIPLVTLYSRADLTLAFASRLLQPLLLCHLVH